MPDHSNTQRSPDVLATRLDSCLSDDEILDFVAGRLDAARLENAHTHLDVCATCQQLVSVAARRSSESSDLEDAPASNAFHCGDVVARRYRIQRFVARGGMGEVYEARDLELKERVALKTVLSTASDGQRAVRRLKAEVLLARRVSHPNVCRIYDLGTHTLDNGARLNFLTMEFVDGERLGERLARGRLTADEVHRTARQLLLGLEAAHAAGILHRDLKCDNVMLRAAPGGALVPVIMDFGLARPIDTESNRVTSGVNAFLGTPCYMAPEQLEGRDLTTASDLYSFGVMWFEMLTGRLPFSLRAPFERLGKPAPRPSSICKEIPSAVEQIVLRCLQRDASRRYSSAHDVLVALDALDAADTPASPVSVIRRTASRPRFAIPVVVVAALAGALAAWAILSQPRVVQPAAAAPESAPPTPSLVADGVPSTPPVPPPTPDRRSARDDTAATAEPPRETAPKKRTARATRESPPAASSAEAEPTAAVSPPTPETELPSASEGPVPSASAEPAPRAKPTPSPEALGFANPFKHRSP